MTPGAGAPGDVLVPTWLPSGLNPWAASWDEFTVNGTLPGRWQLFLGVGSSKAMMVEVSGPVEGATAPEGTSPVTIRGQAGWSDAVADGETGLYWQEGATLSARFKGMTRSAAITFLNGLTFADPADRLDGFAPPAAGVGMTLAGETPRQPNATFRAGAFSYAAAAPIWVPGHGNAVHVETINPTVTAADGVSPDWLDARYAGLSPSGGAIERYDSAGPTLTRIWPDGRKVAVEAFGSPYDQAALRQLADSAQPASPAELTTLRSSVSTRVGGLSQLAGATAAGVQLEVHGVEYVRALCLRTTSRWCANLDPAQASSGSSDQVIADATLDGHRYIAAASRFPLTMEKADPEQAGTISPVYVQGNGWYFGLVDVPSTVTDVLVYFEPDPALGDGGSEPAGATARTAAPDEASAEELPGVPVVAGDSLAPLSLLPDELTDD
jgi:hypothetical protein